MRQDGVVSYIGVGSNLDDPRQQVVSAMDRIGRLDDCEIVKCSSLYLSKPIGFADQPDFINAACAMTTTLEPGQLLKELLQIEEILGRVRVDLPNRPRRVDLDVLLYGTQEIDSTSLTVPHPRMHERRFVLEPLVEIDPQVSIPQRGLAIDLLGGCMTQFVVRLE